VSHSQNFPATPLFFHEFSGEFVGRRVKTRQRPNETPCGLPRRFAPRNDDFEDSPGFGVSVGFLWIAASLRLPLDASLRGPQARGNPCGAMKLLRCVGKAPYGLPRRFAPRNDDPGGVGGLRCVGWLPMDCRVASLLAMTTLRIRRASVRWLASYGLPRRFAPRNDDFEDSPSFGVSVSLRVDCFVLKLTSR
jgi:hypothetical protein